MNCKYRKNIYKWVDGELKGASRNELENHLKLCVNCRKEFELIKKLNVIIRTSVSSIEPSPNFEGRFWQKVLEREKAPWLAKVLRGVESHIPVPNFAQALAVLLVALIIGGAGGVVSAMNTVMPERLEGAQTSVQYLSGFQEFKGIPSSSVTVSYLKAVEERNFR